MATRKPPSRKPAGGAKERKGPTPKWATVERKRNNPKVDAFIARYPKRTQEAMARLRALVHEEVQGAEEAIYWGVPFFFRQLPFCYISPAKKHVTVGFTRGAEFKRKPPALKGMGKTPILKATVHPGYALPEDDVRAWLQEAAAIDLEHAEEDC